MESGYFRCRAHRPKCVDETQAVSQLMGDVQIAFDALGRAFAWIQFTAMVGGEPQGSYRYGFLGDSVFDRQPDLLCS
ncbi:hypothetical protein D3C78_1584310 [compost metagenome]